MYIQTKRRQKKVHLGRDAVAIVLDDEENKWWKGMVSFFSQSKQNLHAGGWLCSC